MTIVQKEFEENYRKMEALLHESAGPVAHAYGRFPDYIAEYMERFLGDTYMFGREDLIRALEACYIGPACGFIHEFSPMRQSFGAKAPPFDFDGNIPDVDACPGRVGNCNCAHSNILGLVLRAIIILDQKELASELLEPIFQMMILDGQFAVIVRMGESPMLMKKTDLDKQRSTGLGIKSTVDRVLGLLRQQS